MAKKKKPDPVDPFAALHWAQQNPTAWLQKAFGAEPWAQQQKVLESVRDNETTLVPSCHASGKSWTAAHIALWWLYTRPHSIVFTTAPTWRQVETILWQELRSAWGRQIIPLGGDSPLQTALKIQDKWFAFGLSADKPEAFQGLHARGGVLGIADEADGIKKPIWDAIKANLSTGDVRLLAIGNPVDPGSYFAEMTTNSAHNTIRISAFDTPNFTAYGLTIADFRNGNWKEKITGPLPAPWLVSPQFVHNALQEEGEDSPFFLSRILALYPQVSSDALIHPRWVEDAHQRWLEADNQRGKFIEMGVDVARYGDDKTVICVKDGRKARIAEARQGLDGPQVADLVYQRWAMEGGNAIVRIDADGVGGPVYDILKRKPRIKCYAVHGAQKAENPERFWNKRAEMYWNLREKLRNGELDLDPLDRHLALELTAQSFEIRNGKILVRPKEEVKEKLKRSPDRADALAYACAGDASTAVVWSEAMRSQR